MIQIIKSLCIADFAKARMLLRKDTEKLRREARFKDTSVENAEKHLLSMKDFTE